MANDNIELFEAYIAAKRVFRESVDRFGLKAVHDDVRRAEADCLKASQEAFGKPMAGGLLHYAAQEAGLAELPAGQTQQQVDAWIHRVLEDATEPQNAAIAIKQATTMALNGRPFSAEIVLARARKEFGLKASPNAS